MAGWLVCSYDRVSLLRTSFCKGGRDRSRSYPTSSFRSLLLRRLDSLAFTASHTCDGVDIDDSCFLSRQRACLFGVPMPYWTRNSSHSFSFVRSCSVSLVRTSSIPEVMKTCASGLFLFECGSGALGLPAKYAVCSAHTCKILLYGGQHLFDGSLDEHSCGCKQNDPSKARQAQNESNESIYTLGFDFVPPIDRKHLLLGSKSLMVLRTSLYAFKSRYWFVILAFQIVECRVWYEEFSMSLQIATKCTPWY